ncbi:MAG: protein phosphatase 2C domain-containing protein [Candidatus Aenigmarchaeota archaeon]|nr:protein phosphatase 2C domain-containing protein [Candidatus Aenigmarchaeota archaeon]
MDASGASEKGLHLANQDGFLIDLKRGLFAVADGVSTSRHGGEASAKAIAVLSQEFAGDLEAAFQSAHAQVRKLDGTTTLTAAHVHGSILDVAHVGDSALFLIAGKVTRITDSDTAEGSNVITQVIGGRSIMPHLYRLHARPGDTILLATDGVANYLTSREIAKAAAGQVADAPAALLAVARKKTKLYEDDKTVVVVRV